MIEVFNLVKNLRTRCGQLQDSLARDFNLNQDTPPIGAFGMCHNTSVMTLELLDHYIVWDRSALISGTDVARNRDETGQRVVLITKSLFILCMSYYEHSAKQALLEAPGKLPEMTGRVYLRRILKSSAVSGLITEPARDLWFGAIELRNIVVHNNGIAETDAEYSYPSFGMTMHVGRMTRGDDLTLFARLVDWTVSSYADWCRAYLQ